RFSTVFLEDFTLKGNYLYGVNIEDFRIFDISNPTAPALVDSLALPNSKLITLMGNHAYVVTEPVGDDELSIVELACSPTGGQVGLNLLDNTFTFLPDGDNLGDHTATMDVDLANFNVTNGGTITADAFIGDGAGLTNVGDDLGNHTATTNLNLDNFNLTNGGILRAERAKLGNINIGNESDDQLSSNQAGNGFTTTPWIYTNAVEAQGERGDQSTLITIGDDGTYGVADEIHLVTDGNSRLQVKPNGNVGIGRNPATYRFEVNGNASKGIPGDWFANSDARLKKNITALDPAAILEKLLALQGITYEWNDDRTDFERPEGIQYGFTAQNIQEVFPTLVEEDADGYLQTAYGTYDAMYVEAFRALLERIQTLETENQRLRKAETQVEARLAKLEALLQNQTKK
ncbi:MAG: tail fiber domain-containing protein, partial [Bacteroidota bacterium]